MQDVNKDGLRSEADSKYCDYYYKIDLEVVAACSHSQRGGLSTPRISGDC